MKLTCWTNLLILSSFISFERGRLVKGSSRGLYHIDQWHCHFSEFCEFWVILTRFCKNWWVFWEKLPYFVQVGGLSDRLSVRRTLNRTIGHEKKVLIESFFEIRKWKTHFDKNGTEQRTFRKNYQAPEKMFQFSFCRFLAKFSIFYQFLSKNSPFLP